MDIRKTIEKILHEVLLEQEAKPDTSQDQGKPEDKPESKPEDKPEGKPEDKPDKKKKKKTEAEPGSINITPGSVGRGRFKQFVGEAGARAEGDPEGLMKDLGVKSAGGSGLNAVLGVLQRAIAFNSLMARAYAGASTAKVKFEDSDKPTTGVRVAVNELSVRDGIKFVSHTLTGAQNAGMLNLGEKAVEIGLHDGEIFIKEV